MNMDKLTEWKFVFKIYGLICMIIATILLIFKDNLQAAFTLTCLAYIFEVLSHRITQKKVDRLEMLERVTNQYIHMD